MKCDGRNENKSEVCLETSEFKVKTSRARGAVHGRKADVPFLWPGRVASGGKHAGAGQAGRVMQSVTKSLGH